eukprot:1830184-Pyramimonas_sp.AAC.1
MATKSVRQLSRSQPALESAFCNHSVWPLSALDAVSVKPSELNSQTTRNFSLRPPQKQKASQDATHDRSTSP